jgi:chromosome partitioning protein
MLQENYAENLWELVIPVDTQFRDASKQGVPLTELNSQARGVMAFEALMETIIEIRAESTPKPDVRIAEVEAYD